jgi:hypothetical protein
VRYILEGSILYHILVIAKEEIFLSRILERLLKIVVMERHPFKKKKKVMSQSILRLWMCLRQMFLKLAVFVEKEDLLLGH